MKRSNFVLALGLAVLGTALVAPRVLAGSSPKLAFHVKDHATKGRCSTASPNGTDTPCSRFVTQGSTMTSYDVYLVLANVRAEGALGVAFGILYDGNVQSGIDVFDWVGCGDLEFPGNGWPASGGGILATWNQCQTQDVGGEGVMITIGSIYTYAYSEDFYQLQKRDYLQTPDRKVLYCDDTEDPIDHDETGIVFFGPATGLNPCDPVATQSLSWSGVKHLFAPR